MDTKSSNATGSILTGTYTSGVSDGASYDPSVRAPLWHQRMQLTTICVCNSLTLIVVIGRIWYRWAKMKHFRYDDGWIAVAGLFLLPYWASQIGTTVSGGGLHSVNVDESDRNLHWQFTLGWSGYYIVASCIKMSACFCFIEILPHHVRKLRYSVYGLCLIIFGLGMTMTIAWIFGCMPVLSNFLWSVNPSKCIDYDIFRWLWVAVSLLIDIALLVIPGQLLRKVPLLEHERKILKLVFSATLLGTITCVIGIYGVYETRTSVQSDGLYHQTAFVMMNDIEILMYTLGASFPVLSRYLVTRATPVQIQSGEVESGTTCDSFAHRIPDFFTHTEVEGGRKEAPSESGTSGEESRVSSPPRLSHDDYHTHAFGPSKNRGGGGIDFR